MSWIVARHGGSLVVTCGFAWAAFGCSSVGRSDRSQELGPLTATEARAIGCYQLINAVRDVYPAFSLGPDVRKTGRGASGRVISPRGGPHSSARWRSGAGDTLVLIWAKSVLSDSVRTNARPRVVSMDAVVARVTLTGETLSGRADWSTQPFDRSAPQSLSYDFRAKRVNC